MKKSLALLVLLLTSICSLAQEAPKPGDNVEPMDETPVFRVKVIARTTKAVNYRHRGGSTTVDLKGTDLMPAATGRAKVTGKEGRLEVDAEISRLDPATKFGPQFLTYVLWAVTPEGRSVNLGEFVLNDNGKSSLDVTTDLQAFGLVITAEPYFAVTRPSDKIVAENIVRQETKGFEQPIDARFDMLEGGEYTIDVPAEKLPSTTAAPGTPLNLLEARNAVAIAKAAGAQQYAGDSLAKAEDMLARAEDYMARKQGRTPIGTAARGATQMAEDARVITLRKQEAERIAAEKQRMRDAQAKAEADAQAAAAAEAQAKAQAEEDARKRAQAEADQKAAEQARAEAQRQQAEADAARAAALAEQQKAQAAAQEAIRQKEEMRARLLRQLNAVLETKDTPRGLVVNMPDVLFDIGKYNLQPAARERLARISGIVTAYPDLKMEVEGHTDSIGSDEFNQVLSEKRANSVRDYLVTNGVSGDNIVARGLGKSEPIADNKTAAGRKLNRRVEMIVSGDVIGDMVGSSGGAAPAAPPQ
ncbi:MAG: OmpA family protein [Acidobacteria bacterium]|jgi:outer membrane protein OmpA-like peptidoglycan-associated protein|nr:OmpA family protein [Acidobacteriota bacterium]